MPNKTMAGRRVLVTGGAGFIGSHLCETLAKEGWEITMLDNLSEGLEQNLANLLAKHPKSRFRVGDCTIREDVRKAMEDVQVIFHLAANPDVRLEYNDPQTCFHQNTYATQVLLDEFIHSGADTIVFASTSTVYGEAEVLPTREDYGPLSPISMYGASKLAAEAFVSSYCHSYKKRGVIVRLANIVGPRSKRGVVVDFVRKLTEDPRKLEVLGDGTQSKSYLYIDDCVRAIVASYVVGKGPVETFNIGSQDRISVRRIAEIVLEEMELDDVDVEFSGGVDGGRGWTGDVKAMLLDTSRLRSRGWSSMRTSEESVRLAVKSLPQGLNR